MGQVVHRDLMRRTNQPPTPAMARRLLKEFRAVTEFGKGSGHYRLLRFLRVSITRYVRPRNKRRIETGVVGLVLNRGRPWGEQDRVFAAAKGLALEISLRNPCRPRRIVRTE